MVATKQYDKYVKAACEGGADVIISGAGLPISLPELVKGFKTKIAPIVSSIKAAGVILKMWDRKYKTTADFIVIEDPVLVDILVLLRNNWSKLMSWIMIPR